METYFVELGVSLVMILVAAELFTNALEHFGDRVGLSEGVTGSVFAAVGTALPETTVPLLAIFAGGSNAGVNAEVGVGAILGAPLMLSTLALCLMSFAAFGKRGWRGRVEPERGGLVRDLDFFLAAFALALVAMYVPAELRAARVVLSLALIAMYVFYVAHTLQASAGLVAGGHRTEAPEAMWFARLGLPVTLPLIGAQLGVGLVLLVLGAKTFVTGVEGVSHALGVSALLLSLLIVPVATELPEKVNSIIWVRRGKDTMAVGNITGAMVFQGTLLPAIGILLTPWQPSLEVSAGIAVTLAAALWLRFLARGRGVALLALLVNGSLYVAYLVISLVYA